MRRECVARESSAAYILVGECVTKERYPEPEKPRQCPFCHGSGECFKCDGTGVRVVRTRRLRYRQTVTCENCEGTGKCQLCLSRSAPIGRGHAG